MNKNTVKIKEGIKQLAHRSNGVISGTVVPGSLDEDTCTISVQPSDNSATIEGVMLQPITGNDDGHILFPYDDSDVIIVSINDDGEWVLMNASSLKKAVITIGSVKYEIDTSQVNIQNGNVVFNVGTAAFKISTAAESLHTMLKDLITGLTMLTVTTPAGPSGPPINIATFTALLTRLDNLLTT